MNGKVRATHLTRRAVVYVRQSSMAQVWANTESTARQYQLRARALGLGWGEDDVVVIDEDLGRSGATAEGRSGFARLTDEVAHGRVGLILALEVSRLARSSSDWQQLMRLCAVADVLVADEHVAYDPSQVDDRLLLDLKGTMSEAELHWLGLRLVGARRNKARRGELWFRPPTGYVWDGVGFAKDPDEAVRRAVEVLFERFEVAPSASAVVKWAWGAGFEVPTRRYHAGGDTDVLWGPLSHSRLGSMLHNPMYAGAYVWGRRPARLALVDGEVKRIRAGGADPNEWPVRILDAHPGYITWARYEANRAKLRDNANHLGSAVRGAPREGDAVLGGLAVCGRCGRRMSVMYAGSGERWRYHCRGDVSHGGGTCWSLEGNVVDEAVQSAFLEVMVPADLELALAVEQQAGEQADTLAAQWRVRIERAEHDAGLAERRYKAVDPDNRVVARTLEHDWELRLREVKRVREAYETARRQRKVELTEADRDRVRALARDLPAVWRSSTTTPAERQAMLRLAIEAVGLHPVDVPARQTRVCVVWRGGEVTERVISRPGRGDRRRTSEGAVERLRQLVGHGLRDDIVAERLNEEGVLSGSGRPWTVEAVSQARRRHGIDRVASDLPRALPLPDRFPDGRYSVQGLALSMGVSQHVVRRWISRGLVRAERGDFGAHRRVWWLDVDEANQRCLATLPSRGVARKPRLPDRHPDGRYSLPGLARRFEVAKSTVHHWVKRSLIEVDREPFGPYPTTCWVRLDDEAVERLEQCAARAARRRASRRDRSSVKRY